MTDSLKDVWRSALEANVRYYQAWGKVANNYVRELGEALKTYSGVHVPTITLPLAASAASRDGFGARSPDVAPPPTIVLEAESGSIATSAVLVRNHLSHPVSAAVVARLDSAGGAEMVVEPDRVDLAPGESVVVRVSATIPIAEGWTEVRGELSVPELVGTKVSTIVRRRPVAPRIEAPAGG